MELNIDAIFEAAVGLPENDRWELVNRLMDSLPTEPELLALDDPNLIEELDRRVTDGSDGIPWPILKNE